MKTSRRAFFCIAWCIIFGTSWGKAQDIAHPNSLAITRDGNSSLNFSFALNMPQMLHRVVAPQLGYAAFLQTQLEISDQALDREIAALNASLRAQAFVTLASGTKLPLKHWQLPDRQSLRDALKTSLILLHMPPASAAGGAPSTTSHVDPLRVTARVESKTPLTRVQLQLSASMHPVWVALKNDKFWLTDQIPLAIIELVDLD